MAIYTWESEADDIFSANLLPYAPFKIILKTKDDPWFVREWFRHHAAIVGPENIVIFDNLSTDESVLSFYEEVEPSTTIVRNRFGVNHIHNIHKCPALYAALTQYCDRFCILDTDERLIMMNSTDSIAAPGDIVTALSRQQPDVFIPTLWLGNAFKSPRHMKMNAEADMINALRWGKPIISTGDIPEGFINHNCQLGKMTDKVAATSRMLLLHLKNLHPEQRISANLRKLESYGFINVGTPAEEAIHCDPKKINKGDATYWISEIHNLLQSKDAPEQRAQMTIEDDRITYSSEIARILMTAYFENSSQFYAQADITPLQAAPER